MISWNDTKCFFYRPENSWFYFTLSFLFLISILLFFLAADPDLFARVAAGRLLARYLEIPRQDPFAYTPKHPLWYDHEWLSGLVFYVLAQAGGDKALFLFKLAIAALTLRILQKAALELTRNSVHTEILLALSLFQLCSVWTSTIRSRVFTHLFIAVFLLAFVLYRKYDKKGLLFSLPLVTALWANLHGGFVMGLMFFFLFTLGMIPAGMKKVYPVLVCFCACVVATLLNPYGIDYWSYILRAVSQHRDTIPEWFPLNPFSRNALVVNIFALFIVGSLLRWYREIPLEGVLLSLLTGFEAYHHDRLGPLFLMVAVVYYSASFSRFLDYWKEGLPRIYQLVVKVFLVDVIAVAAFSLAMLFHFIWAFPTFSLRYDSYPVQACEWLVENTEIERGNVLTSFTMGSFALWRLYPKFRIAIDGRYEEVYPDSTHLAVIRALDPNDPAQRASLEKVWPDFIIIPTESETFAHREQLGREWHFVYSDEKFSILGLKKPEFIAGPKESTRPIWTALF